MSNESALKKSIENALQELGYRVERINAGGKVALANGKRMKLASKGTPDILVLHPYCWLEVKDEEKLNPDQVAFFTWAKSKDVPVSEVHSVAEAVKFVRGLGRP